MPDSLRRGKGDRRRRSPHPPPAPPAGTCLISLSQVRSSDFEPVVRSPLGVCKLLFSCFSRAPSTPAPQTGHVSGAALPRGSSKPPRIGGADRSGLSPVVKRDFPGQSFKKFLLGFAQHTDCKSKPWGGKENIVLIATYCMTRAKLLKSQ